MRILLVGESSFLHNTLKRGLQERGHRVTLMSDGNAWHNSPRDIDLRRDPRWGKLGGLKVLWTMLRNLRLVCGNDIVQVHNYTFVPLMAGWNRLVFHFLRLTNRRVVKGSFADDPFILERQAAGIPPYSDTYWDGKTRNVAENRQRIFEHTRPQYVRCWRDVSALSDAIVACLYEYWLCYDVPQFAGRLHYIPLPMDIPHDDMRTKGRGDTIKVLVGIQPKRDYLKGAMKIAAFVEEVARRHPGRVETRYVEGVPYDEYMRMLDDADVLVDQLYSYTPSMNSLAAMARGTVVVGGGETDYYDFIGEHRLRPIINVRPDVADSANVGNIEKAFFTEGSLERLSRESVEFVRKHHDTRHVAELYEQMYSKLLGERID